MRNLFTVLLILLICQFSFSQEKGNSGLPDGFLGIYKGELMIFSQSGNHQIPMEFHLTKTDSAGIYNYLIVYGDDVNRQERAYTLKTKDAQKGIYVLDENNGILLDCQVVGSKMYFIFEVNTSLLTTYITFKGDSLFFEIVAVKTDKKMKTGGQNDSIPNVLSYPITVVQKAVLTRQ